MIETNSQINEQEIKRYLYGEMTDEQRDEMEEKLFLNDDLFVEVVNFENELVDLYAAGKLSGDEVTRFERSLEKMPDRRAKIANARALQTFIAEEKPEEKPVVAPAGQTFWQKLAEFFTVKTPAFGYAMTALLVLLTLSAVFFYFDNRRKTEELARLQNERQAVWQQKEVELQNQLEQARQREDELKTQIDAERETSGDLTDDLESEKTRREQLERELEKLRKDREAIPQAPTQPFVPTIASIFPSVGTRAGSLTVSQISLKPDAKRLPLRLFLPDTVKQGEQVSVNFDGRVIVKDLRARAAKSGAISVQLTLLAEDLPDGIHNLTVYNAQGDEISKYRINVERK